MDPFTACTSVLFADGQMDAGVAAALKAGSVRVAVPTGGIVTIDVTAESPLGDDEGEPGVDVAAAVDEVAVGEVTKDSAILFREASLPMLTPRPAPSPTIRARAAAKATASQKMCWRRPHTLGFGISGLNLES